MRALVTGGGGFLGSAILRQLHGRGDTVRAFGRGAYPALAEVTAEVVRGNLADANAVAHAVDGCDVVFHVAAKTGVWGHYRDYHLANVVGTKHVLDACTRHGVARLVYTSSPSVVFDGSDEEGIDESAPYCRDYLTSYPKSKAMAEQSVLAANGDRLATVALRPHLIWGPGDPHFVPRIIERGRAGRLRLVGSGTNLVDCTYIENAAAAHVLAADELARGGGCAGKAYFISNGQPVSIAALINRILACAGLGPVTKKISPRMAYSIGVALEVAYRLFHIAREPMMTRFVARQLATAHWFDLTAARRDLGYVPAISIDEGMARLKTAMEEAPPRGPG